jgi:hypothetical protein
VIDAYAYAEALRRPAIVVRRGALGRLVCRVLNLIPGVALDVHRKVYRGRLLSHAEFERFRERFSELPGIEDRRAADRAARSVLWDFCVAQRIPPDKVLAQPAPIQEAMIADFFRSQAVANGLPRDAIPNAWAGSIERLAEVVSPRRGVIVTGPS